jgi:hypothetical protein
MGRKKNNRNNIPFTNIDDIQPTTTTTTTATTTTTTITITPVDGLEGGGEVLLAVDPDRIRFQHSKIRPFFSGCGRSVIETLEEIRTGHIRPSDLPPIQVLVGLQQQRRHQQEQKQKQDGARMRRTMTRNPTIDVTTLTTTGTKMKYGNVKGHRKKKGVNNDATIDHDDEDDEDRDDGIWYFSLNNRRLWVLKRCREEGLLVPYGNKVLVRVREPKSQQERERYTVKNCALEAKILTEKKASSAPSISTTTTAGELEKLDNTSNHTYLNNKATTRQEQQQHSSRYNNLNSDLEELNLLHAKQALLSLGKSHTVSAIHSDAINDEDDHDEEEDDDESEFGTSNAFSALF